jgi:hypothetical protein
MDRAMVSADMRRGATNLLATLTLDLRKLFLIRSWLPASTWVYGPSSFMNM